jgi:hypothetical protein
MDKIFKSKLFWHVIGFTNTFNSLYAAIYLIVSLQASLYYHAMFFGIASFIHLRIVVFGSEKVAQLRREENDSK